MTADYLDRITFGNAEPPARSLLARIAGWSSSRTHLLSGMYALLLGYPLSAPMAAYGKMSAGAKLAYGETYPIPTPGDMHAWYSNLPSNATCEVLIQVACA
jgi:hypothetical protein